MFNWKGEKWSNAGEQSLKDLGRNGKKIQFRKLVEREQPKNFSGEPSWGGISPSRTRGHVFLIDVFGT